MLRVSLSAFLAAIVPLQDTALKTCRLSRKLATHAITLSGTEQTVLIELFDQQIKKLRREIHHTDSHAYRDSLKGKGSMLEDLLRN
jgi:hypothetical protein